jgi:hypothetical protein
VSEYEAPFLALSLPKRRDAKESGGMDGMELDVEELPEYVETEPEKEETEKKERMVIRVRQFPTQEPVIVRIKPEWTVEYVENKLAKAWNKNPRATRLALNGKLLPREARFVELAPQIQGKVLDTIAEHIVGA